MIHQKQFFHSDNLTDVMSCQKYGEYIRIRYEIFFHQGKHEGQTKTIFIDLDELECDGLAGALIDKDYLDEYSNQRDYFTVKSTEIFVANWENHNNCI